MTAAIAPAVLLWPATVLPQQRAAAPPGGIVVGGTVGVVAGARRR